MRRSGRTPVQSFVVGNRVCPRRSHGRGIWPPGGRAASATLPSESSGAEAAWYGSSVLLDRGRHVEAKRLLEMLHLDLDPRTKGAVFGFGVTPQDQVHAAPPISLRCFVNDLHSQKRRASRHRFGQISVSITTNSRGRTRRSVRRTMMPRSIGK